MGRRSQPVDQSTILAFRPPVKTGITLSAEVHKRLQTACLVEGTNQSKILERLIMAHLTGYYSGRRGHSESGEEAAEA